MMANLRSIIILLLCRFVFNLKIKVYIFPNVSTMASGFSSLKNMPLYAQSLEYRLSTEIICAGDRRLTALFQNTYVAFGMDASKQYKLVYITVYWSYEKWPIAYKSHLFAAMADYFVYVFIDEDVRQSWIDQQATQGQIEVAKNTSLTVCEETKKLEDTLQQLLQQVINHKENSLPFANIPCAPRKRKPSGGNRVIVTDPVVSGCNFKKTDTADATRSTSATTSTSLSINKKDKSDTRSTDLKRRKVVNSRETELPNATTLNDLLTLGDFEDNSTTLTLQTTKPTTAASGKYIRGLLAAIGTLTALLLIAICTIIALSILLWRQRDTRDDDDEDDGPDSKTKAHKGDSEAGSTVTSAWTSSMTTGTSSATRTKTGRSTTSKMQSSRATSRTTDRSTTRGATPAGLSTARKGRKRQKSED